MNHLRIALFASLLFSVVSVSAASTSAASKKIAETTNDSGLSKQQILQMRLEPFLEAYQNRQHHSWQVREAAYILYNHYKEQDNQRRLAHLPKRRRRQAKHLYTTLAKWEGNAFHLRHAEMSDGTVVRGIFFRRNAEFEESMGEIIGFYMPSTKINRISQYKRQQVNRWVTRLLRHFRDVEERGDIQHGSEFRHSLLAFQADTAVLQNALSFAPQQSAAKLNEHLGRFVEDVE